MRKSRDRVFCWKKVVRSLFTLTATSSTGVYWILGMETMVASRLVCKCLRKRFRSQAMGDPGYMRDEEDRKRRAENAEKVKVERCL